MVDELIGVERRGRVLVASWEGVFSAALVAALTAQGWQAVSWLLESARPVEPHDVAGTAGLVLVADDRMPDLAGAGGRYGSPVVAIGAVPSLRKAVGQGAVAALDIDRPFTELIAALDRALLGRYPPGSATRLAAALLERDGEARLFTTLTPREQDVLAALITGRPAGDIAATDSVTITTVRSQIRAVLTKLGVSSQLAAVALAHRSCRERRIMEEIRLFHQF